MPKQKPNEQVQQIPLSEIRPFKNHPFKVTDDELMQQTIDSIMQVGVLNPAIIRPAPEGGYEMVAGHRRLHAADLAGLKTIPAIVRNLDDDEAVILMVDSNLQRETISPMERAQAYKMKLEALKHQGKKQELQTGSTSPQVGEKSSWAISIVANDANASRSQVQRFIRLTELLPEGATVKTSKAAVGFQYCNKLFAQERKCAAYKPKYRQEYRQNKELPLLEEYYAWLQTIHPEKGSKLEEAVRYILNQKQPLTAFLSNGEVPISNNLAENAIRPFTLGRKNWLFCDTTKGAEASAIVYSLVESAKANGVEPFAYLQHVLVQLPYLGKTHSHQELESLMPWAPYIQQEFGMKNSDAYVNTYLD